MRLWTALVGLGIAACASGGGALSAPLAGPGPAASAGPADASANLAETVPAPASPSAAGSAAPPVPSAPCADRCSGTGTRDLVAFAMQRAAQAKPCYDRALSSDRALRGSMEVLVRLTDTGAVCATRVLKTSMPADVNECVTRVLGGADYPAPRGGCLDVAIPLSFVPKDGDAGTSVAP